MQEQVGLLNLFERGLEGGHQVSGQLLDEPDGVGEEHLPAVGQVDQARRWIERHEQGIFYLHLGAGQRVQQGRLAAVGVADDGDHRVGASLPALATQRPLLADLLDVAVELTDAVADTPPVAFQFLFAGTTGADTRAQSR